VPIEALADTGKVRTARASLGCLVGAIVLLAARGPSNWSRSFAVAWYGLFACSVVLALAAVAIAVAGRGTGLRSRLKIIALALPALAAVPLLILAIVTLAPLAD
jgi:hypothetical protein